MADEQNPYDAYNTEEQEAEEVPSSGGNEDLGPPEAESKPIGSHPQGFGAEREKLEKEFVALDDNKKEEK
jgi:hypothetical protein